MKSSSQTSTEPGTKDFNPEQEITNVEMSELDKERLGTNHVQQIQNKPVTIGTYAKIQEALKMLNDFFVEQIMNCQYVIKSIDQYTCSIIIENEYSFCLWITGVAEDFRTYDGQFNYIYLQFTPEQKEILHNRLQAIYNDEQMRPEKVAQRKALYDKLKAEFEQIEA